MYIRIFSLFLVALLIAPNLILAQSPTDLPTGPSLLPTPETSGTVNCFDYYHFGSVFPAISIPVQSVVTGSTVLFTVDVENSNTYPVVDGTLYVKIFRSQEDSENTYTQANHVVDQFKVSESVTVDAQDSKIVTFEWDVPLQIGSGEYYAATFFATDNRYNLSGLSFTDDIIGGKTTFTVSSESNPVYFDKNNVTLNGEDYRFVGPPLAMGKTDNVTVAFPVVNDTNTEQVAIIEWKTNEWDSLRDEYVRNIDVEMFSIPAYSSIIATYEVTETGAPVYLVEPRLLIDGQTVSAMNVRFTRADTNVPRINFPSVTNYPIKAGVENTLFSCLHNAGQAQQVPGGELTLTLYDTDNNQLHRYQYDGIITGSMMGIKDTFVPSADVTDFILHAVLAVDGEVVEDVRIEYRCKDINPDLCKSDPAGVDQTTTGSNASYFDTSSDLPQLIALVTILAFGVIAIAHFSRKRKSHAEADDVNNSDKLI